MEQLEPQQLWRHFAAIAAIPHPSKHEAELKRYIHSVAESAGAECVEDEVGNIIIRKAATKGMEQRRGVVLQAHLDMVPQTELDREFDFLHDPLDLYIDGGWLKARGTTLGADNGIGVAAALAILDSEELPHGDIEILLTINEEMGMDGAFGLQQGALRGDILLNLDTEVEGELCIGCAGGLTLTAIFEQERVVAPTKGYSARRLTISGLRGGHSGIEINEQRGNANKLLFRLLRLTKLDIMIAAISGGTLTNAIAREAYADIMILSEELELFEQQVERYGALIAAEYASVESSMKITISEIEPPKSVIEESAAGCLVWAIAAAHDGVYRYSYDIPNLVETSSNLAIVRSDEQQTTVEVLIRSFTEGGKVELADTLASAFELGDAEVNCSEGYPGWQPNPQSEILSIMSQQYIELYGSAPEIKAVHAGLECGVIGATYPNMDMISFGPTILSPHSPAERVEIESVERFYRLLCNTLQMIPQR